MNTPTVSVLMTAYNRQKYIGDAIESVLASTFQDFELIIVDDCSRDQTLQIAQNYAELDPRIRVYQNDTNLGDYPNRNQAAELAQGKYLKYVDSDDIIYPHGLLVMVNSMEQFPEAGLGLCRPQSAIGPHPIQVMPAEAYREHFFGNGFLTNAPLSAIIRSDRFRSVAGFSGKRQVGDMELWLALAARYPVVKILPELTWWRYHGEQEYVYDSLLYKSNLAFSIALDALASSNCPLPAEERHKAILRLKYRQALNIFHVAIKGRQLKYAKKIFIELNLSLFDLLKICRNVKCRPLVYQE